MFDKRVQLLVAFGYDGTRFHGLQRQPGLPTAGAALADRFDAAGVSPRALCFASRTDAGVSALLNLATCWLRNPRDVDAVLDAVSAPRDDGLRDVRVRRVPIAVHARNVGSGKHYSYRIAEVRDGSTELDRHAVATLGEHRCWSVGRSLDVGAMQRAAAHLHGRHDFTAFRARRCNAKDPYRELTQIIVQRGEHDARRAEHDADPSGCDAREITIDLRGVSFLRHMARIIAGTLTEVGAGLRSPDDVASALATRDRGAAGITAPAVPLTLVRVENEWF